MVTLRDFNQNDIDRLVHILNDEAVTKFLSTKIPNPYTKEDAAWWVNEGSQSGEAIRQISDFVFTHTNIVRLFGAVFAGNHASMQLLLKSGFSEEAILKKAIYKNGGFYDKHVFAKLN